MANVVKKRSISSELAQKMANAAVAKARELGVSENVAILDDGGNLKAFSRMDGPRSRPLRLRRIRRTQLSSASPRRTFSTLSRTTRHSWPVSPRLRVWRRGVEGFPLKWTEKLSGRMGERGTMVQNDVDCARAALALVSDAVPVG
jgi:uncharacterized protein GlcG (DUF336 family)